MELRPYQIEGCKFLKDKHVAILADDPGLGKCVQTIYALNYNFILGMPILIVCPKSVIGVWLSEWLKWANADDIITFKTAAEFKFPKPGQIVVCNYEQLPVDYKCHKNTILVADEGHMLKNPKAERTKRFTSIARYVKKTGGSIWMLTGTPILNREAELWGILKAITAERVIFPSGAKEFKQLLGGKDEKIYYGNKPIWKTTWSGNVDPRVKDRLSKIMLRRTVSEVFSECPEVIRIVIPVPSSIEIAGLLSDLGPKNQTFDDWTADSKNIANISRLRAALAEHKAAFALNYIDEADYSDSIVVVSDHKIPIGMLWRKYGCPAISGETTSEARSWAINNFQSGGYDIFGCTIGCAIGFTLSAANRMLFIDRSWTPEINKQCEGRLRSHLKTEPSFIIDFVVDHPLEWHIRQTLLQKQELISQII